MFYLKEIYCLLLVLCLYPYAWLARKHLQKPVWVIGENSGDCLQDNGYCFFKYCMATQPAAQVYFVIKHDSKNYDAFLRDAADHVLHYGSVRHICYFLLSSVCIYTHVFRDIAYKQIFRAFVGKRKIVNIKHGMIALKNVDYWYRKHNKGVDLVIAGSEFERAIIEHIVPPHTARTKVTGLARFDYLQARGSEPPEILYIPTWREWELQKGGDSRFVSVVNSLFANPELTELLAERDVILNYYPHKNMRNFYQYIRTSGNIRLVKYGDRTVRDLLQSNALMITDYSSVAWDFYYLQKPVIFYQYDQDDYLRLRGAYIDLREDLFGDACYEETGLIGAIRDAIDRRFELPEKYRESRQKYYTYADRQNCARIFREIMELRK